ncbi:GntR family transcriptional regulator [Virgibacillus sp. SK37]|uniref:GntR family transcriptional regulator n=1 Tax=Virgibacillus sp. SK37 TaxID=403957 RepID=UPI0004D15D69|nr:GntR family transcriptional regulator [Virgibacillus sp. SK37]AIF44329.1 GntR family transcriptional regulator [Virgibacillus sp. SK37]
MDKQSRIPLYLQLMDELVKKINNQTYQEHEKLPSERELCEIYNLSRITVRQALQELEREGYIYKLHGKGTFIASKMYNQNLVQLYSFTEQMKELGKVPTTKVISFQQMPVDERLAGKMNLQPLEEVFQVIRLRLADQEPLMYETSYLPVRLFPNLTKEMLEKKPMYDLFQEEYQIVVTRARERFSATTVRKQEAAYLQAELELPAMLIRRYAYYQDDLIEYTISIARGDKFDYTVELK